MRVILALVVLAVSCSCSHGASCKYNGQTIPVGDPIPTADICQKCRCGANLKPECEDVICLPPMCYNPADSDAEHCCPYCPQGENCLEMSSDSVLQAGEEQVLEELGLRCRCPEKVMDPSLSWSPPVYEAECTPLAEPAPVE